ncbi:MAG TPA: DedA family protein [bacterium]|nr:DedA family protein [bacterium]
MPFTDPYWLLENATYGLIFTLLVVAGMGLPMPEDVVLLAAGALIHRGATEMVPTAVVVASGVIVGDLVIFLLARHLGTRALERPLFRRLLPERRRQRLERLFDRWGGGIVFVARHIAGIRAPVFALAGMHGLSVFVFLLWDMAGLTISAPLVMGIGYLFSDRMSEALSHVTDLQHVIIIVVVVALTVYATHAALRRWVFGKRRS